MWRLGCRERIVLRNLVRWREQEARRRDIPRSYTVKDEHLVALARCDRLGLGDVASLLPRRTSRRYGKVLVAVHRQGLADREPAPKADRPLNRHDGDLLRSLGTLAVGSRIGSGSPPSFWPENGISRLACGISEATTNCLHAIARAGADASSATSSPRFSQPDRDGGLRTGIRRLCRTPRNRFGSARRWTS